MKFQLLTTSVIGTSIGQDVFLSTKNKLSRSDLFRAQTKKQIGRLAGSTPEDIANKLNTHIQTAGGATKECDAHSLGELNAILRKLLSQSSDELQDIYQNNRDSRARRFQNIEEYEASWINEVDSETLRHSKCFEIGEIWAHHLAEETKKTAVSDVPTVPVYNKAKADDKLYAEASSCQTGHAMVSGGDGSSSHQWPDWPEELHYKATGHGAYPFWWGGGSDSGDADMEVWWSEKQGAEKFYHSSCVGKGTSKGSKLGKGKGNGDSTTSWLNGPCYHLMLAPGASPVPPAPTPPTPGPAPTPSPAPTPGGLCDQATCYAEVTKHCVLTGAWAPCMDCMYANALSYASTCPWLSCRDVISAGCALPPADENATAVEAALPEPKPVVKATGPRAYLYTADEKTCCISEATFGETLAPSQGTFWNTFSYKGEVDFNGKYYQGKAKYYVLSGVNEPVTDFWYFTDLDGKPVQQGEAGTGPTDQGYPVSIGHTIWHDYDPSSLDSSAIDPSNFAIPASCLSTTISCAFP